MAPDESALLPEAKIQRQIQDLLNGAPRVLTAATEGEHKKEFSPSSRGVWGPPSRKLCKMTVLWYMHSSTLFDQFSAPSNSNLSYF